MCSVIFAIQGTMVLAADVDAGYVSSTVSVRGNVGRYNRGEDITLILLDNTIDKTNYTKDNIKYIEQGVVADDGTYSFTFKSDNVANCKLYMNLAGKDVTQTVTEAKAVKDMFDVTINLEKGETLATATANIFNRYNITNETCKLVMAFYDADGRLCNVGLSEGKNIETDNITTQTKSMTIPQGTQKIKAMLWDNEETVIPLADAKVLGDERIVCWGDSLTEGTGGNGTTYGTVLASLSGKEVVNKGIGGQTATQIAARQGGVKILTSEAFTVPETTDPVEIKVKASTGTKIGNRWSNINLNMNCSIDGIDGKLYSKGAQSGNYFEYTWYFQRETAGKSYEVAADTPFISKDSLTLNDNAIAVIWVGTNEGWTNDNIANDYTTYVSYKAICDGMIEQLEVKDYIIVGLTAGKEADYANMKSILTEKYGDRYLDMRSAITSSSEEEFAKYGITLTEADKTAIAKGAMPESMRVDGVHFNANGYTMIGNIMYNRMVEIGILPQKK